MEEAMKAVERLKFYLHARISLPEVNKLVQEMYEVLRMVANQGCVDPKKDTEPVHGGFFIDCFECHTCKARIIVDRLEGVR